jgi:long-chain acyl-CoA synthetase
VTEDTSAYWRKLFGIDEVSDPKAARKFISPYKIFRPLFYALFGLVSRLLFPVKVYGLENLPPPPYIIAPNHQSFLDFPSLAYALGPLGRDLYALANKAYYDNPPARFCMFTAANVVRIDRENDFFPALKSAALLLKLGRPVVIFPEGTRSKDGTLLPFKVGVGTLAVEANVPLVPVYIKGTHKVMPRGAFLFRRGKISVIIGKPVYPKKYVKKEKKLPAYDVYKQITDELRSRVEALSK